MDFVLVATRKKLVYLDFASDSAGLGTSFLAQVPTLK